MTIAVENQPPVANDDSYTTRPGTDLIVDAATGLLANDTDPDGDPLTVQSIEAPVNGVINIATDGSFEYTPDAGFAGTETLTYTITDGTATATGTVTIAVENQPPVANDDSYTTRPGTDLIVDAATGLLANDTDPDGDPLTVQSIEAPANGVINIATDGSFTYTPDAGFAGTETLTYTITDGTATATGIVTIEVNDPTPTSITVSVQNGSPRITWNTGSGGTPPDINVYRGNSASALELVETLTGGETEYVDSQAPAGPLFYAVTAVAAGEESNFSEVAAFFSERFKAGAEWQLLSHPVSTVSLNASGALVYGFNRVYQSVSELQSGTGYWVKSDTPIELPVAGQGATSVEFELVQGWNLIGAPSGSIQVSELEDPGSILTATPVYRYVNGDYETAPEMTAGLGHWIFAEQAGTVTASVNLTPQTAAGTVQPVAGRVEEEPRNRLIASQNGHMEEILLLESPMTREQEYRFMKPPLAPDPTLDLRTDHQLSAADRAITELQLVSESWPVTLKFESDYQNPGAVRIHLEDEDGTRTTRELTDGDALTLENTHRYLAVELIASDEMIVETALEPGYPNPFNPTTNIRYRLAQQADVTVEVYDTGGRRVATLVSRQQQAGTYTVPFNASNLASGIYFVRMRAGSVTNIQKLTLIK
ncbi:hypothetical protein DDZ15_05090 [Rhodohalobacter mucosus]|uniref:Secretion system C-terminal sorting domain-containing protein n=1 Tax=Rhodohalobacter mucosus TaxID=2079485 RepID=A0A316TSN4_9BACT|nr:hypothetical protein DDZ15_05090 [Rhodohalobacter mucosus]